MMAFNIELILLTNISFFVKITIVVANVVVVILLVYLFHDRRSVIIDC